MQILGIKIPFGGGEVGNRRTLALLKKLNYDIVLIPKYIRVNDHSLINSIELLFKIISNIFLFAKTLINGQRKGAIVHIAGFYGIMIYFEYFPKRSPMIASKFITIFLSDIKTS